MIDIVPASVTVSGSLAATLVGAQVAQLGFEAKMLRDVTRLKTKLSIEADE